MPGSRRAPFGVVLLWVAMAFLAFGGYYGGAAMLYDPSGRILHLPLSLLDGLPIHDYALPGLFLFVVFGMVSTIIHYGLTRRSSWKRFSALEARTHRHWSLEGAVMQSILLMAWMVVQFAIVGFHHPIQGMFSVFAVVLFGLTRLRPVRLYYAVRPEGRSEQQK